MASSDESCHIETNFINRFFLFLLKKNWILFTNRIFIPYIYDNGNHSCNVD
jgi:hypothetical protein